MKRAMPYPGTPGGPRGLRLGSQFLFSPGRKKWGGKGQFRYFQERASALQVPRQPERWEKRRQREKGSGWLPERAGRAVAPPQRHGPVPGCGSGCAGRRGRRHLLSPCLPPGPGPALPAPGPPPAPPAAALGGGSAGPARCSPTRAMAAERGGCALEAVPLPPEVRESLAELELELSEGERGRTRGAGGLRGRA